MTDRYVAVFRYPQCTPTSEVWWETSILCDPTTSKREAVRAGLKAQQSDDFAILVIRGGEVVQVMWMDDDIGESQDVMDEYTLTLRQNGVLPWPGGVR